MSKSFCSLLWKHQYLHTNGSFKFCCATKDKIVDKKNHPCNINNTSFEQVWNNEHVRKTRLKMINGETVSACAKCVYQEDRGYQSMRTVDNKENYIAKTNADGSVDHKPNSLEIHYGNLCNLKCKMCSQNYSNQIGKELLEMGEQDPEWLMWAKKESGNVNNWTNNLTVEYKWFKNTKVNKKVIEWISKHVDIMSVLGGEPTIIAEFWELFDYIDQQGTLKNKNITVVTNLTNVHKNVKKWLPQSKSWTIWASVDGIAERTEYIRYPSNWETIVKNLETYKELINAYGNGRIVFSPAIQILNIDQLDDLLEWFYNFSEEKWNTNYNLSWMSQVTYPKMLDYNYAPVEYKLKVADKLEKSLIKFKNTSKQFIKYYQGHINNLKTDNIDNNDRVRNLQNFIKYNDQQDKFRGKTTWRELIPELEKSITKFLS